MARQDSGISVDSRLFERVLESLCDSPAVGDSVEEVSHHEERQQALLELLNTSALDRFNIDRLLMLSKAAKFFQVAEMLHLHRREFDHVVDCYCSDTARRNHVFAYVKKTVASPVISLEEKTRLRRAVLGHLEDLIVIDSKKTTELVTTNLGVNLAETLNQVVQYQNEDVTFSFLCCLFELMDSSWNDGTAGEELQFDSVVYERYVELLCKRSLIGSLISFLRHHDGYRLTKVLEICRRCHVSEAVVILLEKSGDVPGAFEVALRLLRTKLAAAVVLGEVAQKQVERLEGVSAAVENVVSLLSRNSVQLEQTQPQHLWFALFDLLVENYSRLLAVKDDSGGIGRTRPSGLNEYDASSARTEYQSILQYTVSCMVSHVPFTAVLEHVLATGDASCFGNVRKMLTSVMDACQYQKTLYTTCTRIVRKDVSGALGALTVTARSAICPHADTCSACQRALDEGEKSADDEVVCFRCGHAFHCSCLRGSAAAGQGGESGTPADGRRHCVICSKTRARFAIHRARSRVLDVAGQSDAEADLVFGESLVMEALEQLRLSQRTTSRLEFLSELKRSEEVRTVRSSNVTAVMRTANGSALHGNKFCLKLAPPPAQ